MPGHPTSHRRLAVVGAWWMLRAEELVRLKLRDVCSNDDSTLVGLDIVVGKAGYAGEGATPFLACICDRPMVSPLCPACTTLAQKAEVELVYKDLTQEELPEMPLFPSATGEALDPAVIAELAKAAAKLLGEPTTSATGAERFGKHWLRTSGAWWLASKGAQEHELKALGRWSSSAVHRYMRNAPVLATALVSVRIAAHLRGAPAAPAGTAIFQTKNRHTAESTVEDTGGTEARLKALVDTLAETAATLRVERAAREEAEARATPPAFVVNTKSGMVHVTRHAGIRTHPSRWQTRCGWSFAFTPFEWASEKGAPGMNCLACIDSAAAK